MTYKLEERNIQPVKGQIETLLRGTWNHKPGHEILGLGNPSTVVARGIPPKKLARTRENLANQLGGNLCLKRAGIFGDNSDEWNLDELKKYAANLGVEFDS